MRGNKRRQRGVTHLGFLPLRELQRHLDAVLHLAQEFFDPLNPAQGAAAPYRFFHTSFREFIAAHLSDVERQSCHGLLAQGCTSVVGTGTRRPGAASTPRSAVRDYALRHRLAHLIAVQDWQGVVHAFADVEYIIERSEQFGFANVHADALTAAQDPTLPREWQEAFSAWERFLRWRIERLDTSPKPIRKRSATSSYLQHRSPSRTPGHRCKKVRCLRPHLVCTKCSVPLHCRGRSSRRGDERGLGAG